MINRHHLKQKDVLPRIKFYLDFDGTLSGREGSGCVFSDLYKSLQVNPADHYAACEFKEDRVALLKAGFELPENKTMRMSKGALSFLKDMIAQEANVNIISRNRKEYISAVLQAEGMEAALIERINIRDVNDLIDGKYQTVVDMEKNKVTPAEMTIVCDDNPGDCNAMKKAVIDGGAKTKLISYSSSPGTFDWQKIALDLKSMSVALKEEKILGKFFKDQATSANDPQKRLIASLHKGTPHTYSSKPNNQYLVFNDEGSFNEALSQLRLNNYQEASFKNYNDKAYDFRVAAQAFTLEIRGQITIDAGKLSIATPLNTTCKTQFIKIPSL